MRSIAAVGFILLQKSRHARRYWKAWLEVESAAADVLQMREPTEKVRMLAPMRLGELLNRNEIINRQQLEIFHRLRDLRNKAVHIAEVTFQLDEIIEYIDLAWALATQIRKGTYGA